MKALIFFKPDSEHARVVDEFIHEFRIRSSGKLETVDVNSRDGGASAQLYDIMQFPAVIAVSDDGQLLQRWQGEPLPLINDVAGYLAAH